MKHKRSSFLASVGSAMLLCVPSLVLAQPYLGSNLSPFAVLGASTVTNTGPSVITGDLGLYAGPSVTGFAVPPANTVVEGPGSTGLINGPGLVSGTIYISHATANLAQVDLTTASIALTNLPCGVDLSGSDLGGLTLTPGVYCFSSSAQLTGTLTLNAQNDPNAVWVFQIGSTLTTASNSSVVFINGSSANACGVQWRVGSSATIGTGTSFAGNILAEISVTLNTGANVIGRALARIGAVTLDTNNISFAACSASAPPPFPGTSVPTLPVWAIMALVALLSLVGLAAMRRRAT
jgi:hypothetical protein